MVNVQTEVLQERNGYTHGYYHVNGSDLIFRHCMALARYIWLRKRCILIDKLK